MADLSQRKNRTTQRRQSACRREKIYYLKGSNHFNKRNNHFNKRGIVPSSKKNNRSAIEKQLPHHRKRAASPPKNSCFTTEKQTFNRWQTDIASMANHHLNEEKPSTKVSQSLLLGDNFLSPERKKFFTYTTQSETIEKGINTSQSTGFFHWIYWILLIDLSFSLSNRPDSSIKNTGFLYPFHLPHLSISLCILYFYPYLYGPKQ